MSLLSLRSLFIHCILLFLSFKSWSQSSSADIYKDIHQLGVLASVLYVAAHPDDENTRMISYLSNHLSARTTYLSMTRGDGGQNLIGPEIREMLGLIRTHELLGARAIDGGHQLFTRANDFGYSKSAAETMQIWDRNEVLSDVVWAIRKTKPDVIINRFNTDTGMPNHGHHTASAILSVEAYDLAGSPAAFPEQLKLVDTWQPRRIFFNTSWFFYGSREAFEQADKSRMLAVDIGSFDEVTGESNSEIAGRSRSMHKSQGFGSAETRGESLDYLELLDDANDIVPKSLFEGIDITWSRIPGGAPIGEKVKMLENNFDFKNPSSGIPLLLEIHSMISALSPSFWKTVKLEECESLIQKCLGLFFEVRTSGFRVSPGQLLNLSVELINRSDVSARARSLSITGSDATFTVDHLLEYNQPFTREYSSPVPPVLSIPYWLEEAPSEGMYTVTDQVKRGLPANEDGMIASLKLDIGNTSITLKTPVVYRTVDPAEGEVYRPLSFIPPVTVGFEDPVLVFQKGSSGQVALTLTANQDSVAGTLQLSTNNGWTVTPTEIPFSFIQGGESFAAACTVTPSDNATSAILTPEIHIDDKVFHHQLLTLDYEHIPYMDIVRDASVKLQSVDIKIINRPIAYIQGAGDEVPQGLRQIGYNVDIIEADNINTATLQKYQVVMLGVRAFNTIESLAYKNKILYDWVKSGGTLIVQYNVSRGLVTSEVAPFPITLSRERTTEESAPVIMLDPDHAAMRTPNKLDAADFDSWVQERGLYFPNQWDPQLTPLLEMNDSNEAPLKGALLVGQYGEGYYVYTGISFFRQIPAGVPGAYRLLSNLISLGYKNNKS